MSSPVREITAVGDLFALDPLARFHTLLGAGKVPAYLRAEPIVFDMRDPIYGYGCSIPGCGRHSTQAGLWCTDHAAGRLAAIRAGDGEAQWKATATPLAASPSDAAGVPRPACRFCPDRDAAADGLCLRHRASRTYARGRAADGFDEERWAARQHALPGVGGCRAPGCTARAEVLPGLCPRHRLAWLRAGSPERDEFAGWLPRAAWGAPGVLVLAGLAPLLAAEIRYALWAHTLVRTPARWHPMLLRTLAASCRSRQVGSLLELDPGDQSWTTQAGGVNRVVRAMRRDVDPIHHSRAHTRDLGYLDTNYWGLRLKERRSVFDLTGISQRWLRELTWDHLADTFDGPNRPRSPGVVEAIRRAVVCFSAYLRETTADAGEDPAGLDAATARGFVADFTRRITAGEPARGMPNRNGRPSPASPTTYQLTLNALRRVMRAAMDTGAAETIGLPREFVVAVPYGGATFTRNPRPFSDGVLATLSDPANIALLGERDPHDGGLADIWSIQVRCGRRISEVIGLRLDCVSEHLARTWMWVDMTKVGKLDYAVQIPRDVYEIVRARQVQTVDRYRLKHGAEPDAATRRVIALFPSRVANPSFQRPISTSTFTQAFKAWIESDAMHIPGHTTHQARHSLATRLIAAGASMVHVKRVLGHVSERMGESYVLIAGSQVEPYLQQVWVTGPGNTDPGHLVMTPTDAERQAARRQMVDLAAVPTEHGLCTFKPVVGGHDCPYNRDCHGCEHFVLTGADYGYWKRQEQRWAALAEAAPDDTTRDYLYRTSAPSSRALAGLEKALLALGLLDQARQVDLRSPHQDFFDPIWRQGWRADDLSRLGADSRQDDTQDATIQDTS